MATTITVTGTITDPSGTGLQGNAFIRFLLRNFQGFVPQVNGSAIIDEIQIDCLPNSSGVFTQALWANNSITPATTFYTVQLWNQGRIVSSGNYIFDGNTNLNTAAQLNTPPVPPGFLLVLMNNGALNSSQSTLNLVNTDGSVTITDLGSGSIQLTAAGAAPIGANIVPLAPPTDGSGNFVFPGGMTFSTINMAGATNTLSQYVPGNSLLCQPASWNVTIATAGATTVTMQLAKCTRGTGAVLATQAVTFNSGQTSPTFGAAGFYTSDTINFALTPAFDYYFLLNSSSGLMKIVEAGSGQSGAAGGCYVSSGNLIGQSTLTFTGGTLQGGKNFTVEFTVV